MTFIEMMQTEYNLNESQANELQKALKELETYFDDNFEDSKAFFETFYAKFEQVIADYGFNDTEQAEPLVASLYRQGDFEILVTYVISAFYNSGGDSERFADTYQRMMNIIDFLPLF